MPTYEYRCRECDHFFEAVQKMTDDPLAECPECGGAVKRLIGTGAGIIFKGSGFYETDYRSESYRRDAAKEKPTAGSSSSDSSKKAKSDSGGNKTAAAKSD